MIHIALLRGINVSGQKKIRMADLRASLDKAPFTRVETYIQSGNLILESSHRSGDPVARKVSDLVRSEFGHDVTVIVRTPRELETLVRRNPFTGDTARLYVTFLDRKPGKAQVQALANISYPPEEFVLRDRDLYFYAPQGAGKAKMNNNFFERKLQVRATSRNWNTVNTLIRMARG